MKSGKFYLVFGDEDTCRELLLFVRENIMINAQHIFIQLWLSDYIYLVTSCWGIPIYQLLWVRFGTSCWGIPICQLFWVHFGHFL